MKKSILSIIFLIAISTIVFAQEQAPGAKKVRVMEQKYTKGDDSPEIDSEATFDANGNIIEEVKFKDGKIDSKVTYKFDEKGNKISETKTDKTGKIYEIIEYKYNNNLRVEKLEYDGKKKLIKRKVYEYEMR